MSNRPERASSRVNLLMPVLLCAVALIGGGCAGVKLEQRPEGPQGLTIDITAAALHCMLHGRWPVLIHTTRDGQIIAWACAAPAPPARGDVL